MKTDDYNNNNEDDKEEVPIRQRPTDEEYSISIMKKYPLGFNKTEKECEDEVDDEAQKSQDCIKTPRKKKKNIEDSEDADNEDTTPNCIYNVWVPDCLRSRKDFIECQQINLHEIDTKEVFEKVFNENGYFSSVTDYDDFLECGKGASTRILQGVETKFKIEIDVSDSFFALTGTKLRAYSFQGNNRKIVYSAFSYFRSSWTQEMSINTITNYDMLFQPDDWYYSVIHGDQPKKIRAENRNSEVINASNKTGLTNFDESELGNLKVNRKILVENFNQNRLDTNSEVDSIEIVNNESELTKQDFSKNDNFLKLCFKYLRSPKNRLKKFIFTSFKNQTESISYTVSNMARLVNENNNKNKESISIDTKKYIGINSRYKVVNFLLDSYNKPIPIWIKF